MKVGHWTKEIPFTLSSYRTEKWRYHKGRSSQNFDVMANFGKQIALGTVKRKYSFDLEYKAVQTKRKFFEKLNSFEKVGACPVCAGKRGNSSKFARIWKAEFLRCQICSHIYANIRPTANALQQFYKYNSLGKDYYQTTDKSETDLRLDEIYVPKIEWALKAYRDIYGTSPRSIVDLGAGTGHLLAAARRLGLKVAGLEIDVAYQKFAREVFGLRLSSSIEHLSALSPAGFDLVTSFNVIEHLVSPSDFLDAHVMLAGKRSLAITETPNAESFTVWLQTVFPKYIRGYLSPYEHIQLFTQNSLATLLVEKGFEPTHLWVFGQDLRELIFQIYMDSGIDHSTLIKKHFNEIQLGIDQANFGDLIVMASRLRKSRTTRN